MKLAIVSIFAGFLWVWVAQPAQAADAASPIFNCVIETEFEALNPALPQGGVREPAWDVEFQFDTATGMLRYDIVDEPGYDEPRRWDIVQQGGDGTDWIAVYRPELGPEQNRRANDASVVLRIRGWADARVPGSEAERNRFYILQYDVFGVGRCAAE